MYSKCEVFSQIKRKKNKMNSKYNVVIEVYSMEEALKIAKVHAEVGRAASINALKVEEKCFTHPGEKAIWDCHGVALCEICREENRIAEQKNDDFNYFVQSNYPELLTH